MSKKEFLVRLRLKLGKLSEFEQERFIAFYEEFIQDMMDNGMSEEEAVAKQGDVDQIAADIISEVGGKKFDKRKGKMFTLIATLFLLGVLFAVIIVVSSANKKMYERKLKVDVNVNDSSVSADDGTTSYSYEYLEDGNYDKSAVEKTAVEIIYIFSEGKYQKIAEEYALDNMAKFFNEKYMENEKKKISDNWGSIMGTGKVYSTAVKENGKEYVSCEVSAMYENVTVNFSITFDSNMKIAGFFMK